MKAKSRSFVYLVQIVLGVIALSCAVLIQLGIITMDSVTTVVAAAVSLYFVLSGALARMNLTPDAPGDEYAVGGTDD